MHGTGLSGDTLNEHPDGHSRRESMRVDDDIRLHAALAERHVDHGELLRTDSLLSMSGRELVTNDW